MLQIDDTKNLPIYEQLVLKIKELCLLGVLKPGEKLPSVRELSAMLIVNPNTVSKAYQELERQGIIETRQGKGTFVAQFQRAGPDERKKAELREKIKRLAIDAIYAGLSLEEVKSWIEEEFNRLGGKQDAGS